MIQMLTDSKRFLLIFKKISDAIDEVVFKKTKYEVNSDVIISDLVKKTDLNKK